MSNERIEYIDLAKGICILLVVALHCQIEDRSGILVYLRMPFYFFISGLFFKDYGSFKNFLVKKTKKLIIPFVFFYILIWIFHWIFQFVQPGFWSYPGSFWGDLLTGSYMNVPIWFLLSLFWCNLLYWVVQKLAPPHKNIIVIAVLTILGCLVCYYQLSCPFYFLQPLIAIPFFYLGSRLRYTDLILSKGTIIHALLSIILFASVYLLEMVSDDKITFKGLEMHGNPILYYLKSITLIIATILLCKCIKTVPVVSYCGRYSIIILGTHVLYREIAYHIPNWIGHSQYDLWYQFFFVLTLSVVSIPIYRYLFPYFTAQK